MSRLHHTVEGDDRPHNEHPLTAFGATVHALAALRGRLAPVADDQADAAYFIADLREQAFDVLAFAGEVVRDVAARDATARALVAMQGKREDASEAPSMISELRSLGFDVRKSGG